MTKWKKILWCVSSNGIICTERNETAKVSYNCYWKKRLNIGMLNFMFLNFWYSISLDNQSSQSHPVSYHFYFCCFLFFSLSNDDMHHKGFFFILSFTYLPLVYIFSYILYYYITKIFKSALGMWKNLISQNHKQLTTSYLAKISIFEKCFLPYTILFFFWHIPFTTVLMSVLLCFVGGGIREIFWAAVA